MSLRNLAVPLDVGFSSLEPVRRLFTRVMRLRLNGHVTLALQMEAYLASIYGTRHMYEYYAVAALNFAHPLHENNLMAALEMLTCAEMRARHSPRLMSHFNLIRGRCHLWQGQPDVALQCFEQLEVEDPLEKDRYLRDAEQACKHAYPVAA
jgi:hypothetical protein